MAKFKEIEISESLYDRLAEAAKQRGVSIESLAWTALLDFVSRVEENGTVNMILKFGSGKFKPTIPEFLFKASEN